MVTRPDSIRRSASRREQMPWCVKNLLMRSLSVTGGYAVSMDATARFDRSQHAVDKSSDTKLGSDKPLDPGQLADIHPEDTRSIGQGRHEVHRVVPPQPTGLRSAERRNQRGVEPITVEGQVDRPPTGLHHLG